MMHLEAIIERNANPAPPPSREPMLIGQAFVRYWADRRLARLSKRPWDKPDPLPEAEAHPR